MEPSAKSGETSGLKLPTPVSERAPAAAEGTAEATKPTPENAPAAAEQTPSRAGASAAALAAIPLPPVPQPKSKITDNDVSSTSDSSATAGLDDSDLIEKEWVDKAKHIVERTRDDPHKQSEELTVVKADYMKQRYDKTIKLSK